MTVGIGQAVLQLISEGKPIRYEGVIGPMNFDQFGEISTTDGEAIKANIK